jgi:hypothetical protein
MSKGSEHIATQPFRRKVLAVASRLKTYQLKLGKDSNPVAGRLLE